MGVLAARIDNRLLHGIVASRWVPEYQPQRLMVISDDYAGDPNKKAAMRMAKPSGVALSIISRETAYENFKAGKYDGHSVFVVVDDPQIIRDLQRIGQSIPVLVIGGTSTPDEAHGSIQVSRRAYVLEEQVDTYKEIMREGTHVIAQYIPTDKAVEVERLLP